MHSASSVFPQRPSIIVPRQSGETLRPERPRLRYSIVSSRGGGRMRKSMPGG